MVGLYPHFTFVFTRQGKLIRSWLTHVFLYLPPSAFLYLFLTTDHLYKHELVKESWGYTYPPGDMWWVFGIYSFAMYCLTIYLLIQFMRKKTSLEKKQVKPIMIGTSVFLVMSSTTNLAFPALKLAVPETGTLMSIVWMLFTLYAIRKHKLFITVPSSEQIKRRKPNRSLKLRGMHFIKEEGVEKSYEIFKDQLESGALGLAFSKFGSQRIREKCNLRSTPIIPVNFNGNGENTVSPKDMDSMESAIHMFFDRTERVVVLIDCFTEMRLTNGFEKAKAWLERIEKSLHDKNSVLLITANPVFFESEELQELRDISHNQI